MVGNVIQIESGLNICVNVSEININGSSVVTCDEIIDVVVKPYNKPTNFNKKRQPEK